MKLILLNRREAGFTLVEMLVSFAILTLMLGLIVNGLSFSSEKEANSDFSRVASILGKSHLAALGEELRMIEGNSSGEFSNGYSWTMNIQRRPGNIPPRARGNLAAFWVFVKITKQGGIFGKDRSLSLVTLKLQE